MENLLLSLLILQLSCLWMSEGCSPFNMESGSLSSLNSPSPSPSSTFLGVSSARGTSSIDTSELPSSIFPASLPHRARVQSSKDRISPVPPISISNPSSSTQTQISDATELACFNFDLECKWRNVEGLLVDELNWYQGTGMLDQTRLQIATSTHLSPEGKYAIVATETVQLPTAKAILVSDIITCQIGNGQLKFMYWTSPEVRLKVCSKETSRIFPDYNFCSPPIETGDPGPSFTLIPSPDSQPFQLYIIAENFVFHAANLQGGFAIIDSIEYFADMCDSTKDFKPEETISEEEETEADLETFSANDATNLDNQQLNESPVSSPQSVASNSANSLDYSDTSFSEDSTPPSTPIVVSDSFPTLAASIDQVTSATKTPNFMTKSVNIQSEENPSEESKRGFSFMNSPIQIGMKRRGPLPNTVKVNEESESANIDPVKSRSIPFYSGSLNEVTEEAVDPQFCSFLVCSFNRVNECARWVLLSNWKISSRSVGNPLTGIRGDAMALPYRNGGSYAYVSGPISEIRLTTPSFELAKDGYFVFSYHKVDKQCSFRVFAKRDGESKEEMIFEAPEITKESRRWFREGRDLPAGAYQYISFEVRNLSANNYIGLDEFVIYDTKRRPYCNHHMLR